MLEPATPYAAWGETVDVARAAAILERNAAPQGFLFIEGVGLLPRVSTILDQLAKPALQKWKEKGIHARYWQAARNLAQRSTLPPPAGLFRAFQAEVRALEDAERKQTSAATLGTAFHTYAEWRSKGMLGLDAGEEPACPEAIEPAIDAWEQWVQDVDYRPILVEHRAWCTDAGCGYTGGLDAVAEVEGRTTLCDWKRARSIYETYLAQVASYDHLLTRSTGLVVDRLLVVRLPQEEPGPVETRSIERDEIPEHYAAFRALLTVWHWSRAVVEHQVDARAALRRQSHIVGQASPFMEMTL